MLYANREPRICKKPYRTVRTVRRLRAVLRSGRCPGWMEDAHDLLIRACEDVLAELSCADSVSHIKCKNGAWIPHAVSFSESVVCNADEEALISALKAFGPDEKFLRTLPAMRSAHALCELYTVYKNQSGTGLIGQWLDQLRYAQNMDWRMVHDAASCVEHTLMQDPGGDFGRCDEESRALYREAVRRLARKQHITEEECAKQILHVAMSSEEPRMRHLSAHLFPRVSGGRGAAVFLVIWLCALLCAGCAVWALYAQWRFYALILGAVMVLPFYALMRVIADRIGAHLAKRVLCALPRYSVTADTVPEEGACLTVITALLHGGENDCTLAAAIGDYAQRNRGRNLYFGLLCDLPRSDAAHTAEDDRILSAMQTHIDALNRTHGARFCLFIRRREYAPGEDCYMGWERKRGAVLALARLMRGVGRDSFLCASVPKGMPKIQYLCTLDEDTQLPPDALYPLIGAMLHPHNKPIIEGGAVVSGCAVLQPAVSTTLGGAAATHFTMICASGGGLDPYSRLCRDGEAVLWGEGSFCGKGILDIDAYLAVLDGAFPDGVVLSHDFLEGARLGCRNIPSVTFPDAVPTRPGAYFARQSRWVRGDVQALCFAGRYHRTADGSKVKNPISLCSKFRVIDHFVNTLVPPAILRGAILLAFLPVFDPPGMAFLWVCLFSSRLFDVLSVLLRPASYVSLFRRFHGAALSTLSRTLQYFVFRIAFCAQEAYVNARAVFTALLRLFITKRHLLEWVTAGEGEGRGNRIRDILTAQLPSLLCGGLLLVLSPHVSAKLLGIVWLTTPLLSAWLSRSPVHRTEAMPDLKTLSGWAEEVWSYFSKYVSQDTMYLPPDNVQFFPDRDPHPAYRTSPTNIGLYLCACAAARDFSFITTEELYTRYEAALSGMERLQTYRGHFYNWYDIREGGVLGAPFVSAVDSGNLACSLICAAGAALEWTGEDERLFKTAERLRRLAARMDFSFLYDTKRRKMHIGYDTESGVPTRAYYDLYCSEARSAVYYAIAAGQIPSAAWSELRMPLLSTRGWLGAQSWTGSAFEYFMPVLWLSHPKDSFTREILHFAADAQSRDVLNITHGSRELSLFGKSEGAYFGIDSDRQFQYKPYGCADLALSVPDQKERLCMPYALFLMLCEKPTDVCRALHTLDVLGMHGACGYYEALDATHLRVGNGYAVVRSYMAHHLGMTIMALANAAFDGIFVKRFHRDAQMGAYQILQERRIPTDAVVAGRTVTRGHSADSSSLCTRESLASSASDISCCVGEGGEAQTAMISNSALCVLASVMGGMSVRCGEDAITPWSYEGNALSPTVLCTDIRTGRCYLPFAKWGREDGVRYSFHCGKGVLEWAADYPDQMRCVLRTELSSQGLGVRFSVSLTEGGIPQPMLLVFLTRPVLIGHRAHSSHPAFADLFLISEIDSQAHQIRVHRRVRTPDERPYVLNACAKSLGGFRAVTDASALLPPGYGDREVRRLGEIRSDNPVLSARSAPSAVTPVLCMLGRSAGTAEIQLTLGALQTRFDSSVMQELHAELRQMCGALRTVEYREMLCAIKGAQRIRLYESKLPMRTPRAPRGTSRLWKYGISGDLPYLCFVALEDEASLGHLGWVLGAWKYLLLCGIGSDLVLCVKETDVYGHPVDGRIRTCIHQRGLSFFMGEGSKRGALRICLYRDAVSDGLLLTAAAVYGDTLQPRPIEAARDISIFQTPRRDDRLRQCRVEDGCAVIWDGAARMPWSHILSNGVMGCLMTQHTLGFTFFENARECRVTPWWGDASREESGELILMRRSEEGAFSDLCGMADTTIVMPDAMHYLGAGNGFSYRITVTIPNRSRTKEISISVRNESDVPLSLILRYQLMPLLGVSPIHGDAISFFFDTDGLHFRTETGDRCAWYEAILSLTGAEKREGGPWGDQMLYAGGMLALAPGEEQSVRAYLRIKRYGERELAVGAAKQSRSWQYPVIKTDSAQLDALASAWLPWQTVTVRMFARCGYYQPGGAYGFRDQLQDALAASIFAPELLYAQLFRAAAHQYPEGDVQHWWHPGPLTDKAKFHPGIRSRCSDDLLWLPLCAAAYYRRTGDAGFLMRSVRYVESAPLAQDEHERYEVPLRSALCESLYMHCVRAIECVLSRGYGIHGLPLMGIGDWNDGMNRVGVQGKGESVWGGMLLLLVLAEFIPLCELCGDTKGALRYAKEMRGLEASIESDAWNGAWYRRAWYDDATPMGDAGDPEAEIDVLPQAFAAILHSRVRLPGGGRPFSADRVQSAMRAAYERLFDPESSTFALLTPAFGGGSDSAHDPGYIAAYPPGIRENGGQYTHAAVWGAMGLFAADMPGEGMEVLHALSPLKTLTNTDAASRYQKEPWALCGDVLRARGRVGEGGWSLYTGSAGWYYRLLWEVFGDGENR